MSSGRGSCLYCFRRADGWWSSGTYRTVSRASSNRPCKPPHPRHTELTNRTLSGARAAQRCYEEGPGRPPTIGRVHFGPLEVPLRLKRLVSPARRFLALEASPRPVQGAAFLGSNRAQVKHAAPGVERAPHADGAPEPAFVV